MKQTLYMILSFILMVSSLASQTTVNYDITFTSIWNETDHTSVPSNAHWSRLVGATHKTSNAFIQEGSLATTGIKDVAETGNDTIFSSEVTIAIDTAEADQYINGPGLATATGDILISNLQVSQDYPFLSLVSMIAPSPDWFIALNSYSLLDGDDNWKTIDTVDVFAYDAGTDGGVDYTSGNVLTSPFETISMASAAPLNGNKIGTIRIILSTTGEMRDMSHFDKVNVYPNPVSNGHLIINNLENTSLKKVDLFSISGAFIQSFDKSLYLNKMNLDVSNISSGSYLLKLIGDAEDVRILRVVIK